jgi:putative toxin-antitoxin system antitoxin component (TIGR02293 family)
MIRQGFPTQALDSLGANTQAHTAELAQLLDISVRMLAQRRRTGFLSQQESERLFRVARVLARAEELFGNLEKAFRWLNSPIIVLSGATPLSLLDTEVGGKLVMDTLGRIEHGIPA